MDLTLLQHIWYAIFTFSMFAYATLDGLDIGVGCLHLFTSSDKERRLFVNAIGPVWDSNSLWIIILSGVLFAGFPLAFSALFSTMYLPLIALVFGFMLRAAAIEFRSKLESNRWRRLWDRVFAIASYMLSCGLGYVFINLIHGLPINTDGVREGPLVSIFSPESLILCAFTTLMFMLHGALYLNIKLDGEIQIKIQKWIRPIYRLFLVTLILMTITISIIEPKLSTILCQHPWLFAIELIGIIGVIMIPRLVQKRKEGLAFISSTVVILSMILNYTMSTFPNLISSTISPETNSLSISNASATSLTMNILFGIALVGVPFFLMYCGYTYKIFRGKVEINSTSY